MDSCWSLHEGCVGYICLTDLWKDFASSTDFWNAVAEKWKATPLSNSKAADRQYGPEGGLADSEIMTASRSIRQLRFQEVEPSTTGIVLGRSRACFPGAPCYQRFHCTTSLRADALRFFSSPAGWAGRRTYDHIDTHRRRLSQQTHRQHKVFTGLAAEGRRTSMGWFFGFKSAYRVQLIEREIVALKLTSGNAADT